MTTKHVTREAIEKHLRQQFEDSLGDQIDDCLDREREVAIENFIDEWEALRCEELVKTLTEKFEDDLDDAIERELEMLETA
jgi:hypothetical protein